MGIARTETDHPEPLLLRVEEVGQRLAIGRTKAWELVARGQIPSIRIGKSVRVPRAELERWVSANTEGVDR